MKNFLILAATFVLLTACSLFSPVKTEPTTTYLINTTPHPATKKPHSRINLLVTLPEASSIYNTTSIAYTVRPYQIGYFAKSSWAETPSQMLQPLLIQTLRKTHYFNEVDSTPTGGPYSFILNTQLVQLQLDFSQVPHRLHFVIRAELLKASSNQVIASKEFAVHEVLRQNNTYAGVIAANQAAAQLLSQISAFCLRNINQPSP